MWMSKDLFFLMNMSKDLDSTLTVYKADGVFVQLLLLL